MNKYKVSCKGFFYVEAEDREEALEMAKDGQEIYSEFEFDEVKEVDEFIVMF